MAFDLSPLLIHSESVPPEAREQLKNASLAAPPDRAAALEAVARTLYRAAELDCADARELVGLPAGSCS